MKKLIYSFVKDMKFNGLRRSVLFASLLLFMFSGCSRYQYIAISGNTHQNKTENFVVENDTAKVVYSFSGDNFPVRVQIYNKLNRPIYVDWDKTLLTVNGKATSYWQNSATFTGSFYAYSFSGTIHTNEKISYIPPRSYVESPVFYLKERLFNTRNFGSAKVESYTSSSGQEWGWRKKYSFNKENSPLKLKSYIALSTDKDFSTEFHLTSSFWVNNVSQTGVSPKQLQDPNAPKTYIHKLTTGGLVLGTVLTLGIVSAGIALLK